MTLTNPYLIMWNDAKFYFTNIIIINILAKVMILASNDTHNMCVYLVNFHQIILDYENSTL